MCAAPLPQPTPREGYIPVTNAELYFREIGSGQPLLVLHGGPDFDHSYFLPALDRLADSFRLIYYAQRGRGKSSGNVRPGEVSIQSEIEDLDAVRAYFDLNSVALLGHSWGGVLAMEYAIRHPNKVSHLILMNTAPASHDDYMQLRRSRRSQNAPDIANLKALASTVGYAAGDLDVDAAYYRIHFNSTLRRPDHLESVVKSLRQNFTPQDILKAREIESRLIDQTWLSQGYDLLPMLKTLAIPTLLIHGGYDFIPLTYPARIAGAIPQARLVVLKDCGHFSYLDCPDEVRGELLAFFGKY